MMSLKVIRCAKAVAVSGDHSFAARWLSSSVFLSLLVACVAAWPSPVVCVEASLRDADYTVLKSDRTQSDMSTAPALPPTLARGIEQLEPMPVTAQRLVALMQGEDVSLANIAELVEFDQAIAASVLRLARSWTYGGSRPPETVRDAVVRLGTVPLLNLILGDYLARIRTSAPLYDLSEDDLWAHAAAAQLAVRALMQEYPEAKLPTIATTAALLHDIGKLVMSRCLHASVDSLVQHAKEHDMTFVEAEQALFGINHAAVGAAIAVEWQFPDLVTDSIARHHDADLGGSTPVLDAVVIANMVAKNIGVGLGAEGFNLSVDSECVRRLGLDFNRFARLCLQTDTWLQELQRHRV